jgi:proteic killer suppression protein
MIKAFRSKGLAELFADGKSKRIQQPHAAKLKLILTMLNAASDPNDLSRVPAFKFHHLKGPMKGSFAVSVDANTRVMFGWRDGHAVDVDYVDYH